jgi:hypothetical protein
MVAGWKHLQCKIATGGCTIFASANVPPACPDGIKINNKCRICNLEEFHVH